MFKYKEAVEEQLNIICNTPDYKKKNLTCKIAGALSLLIALIIFSVSATYLEQLIISFPFVAALFLVVIVGIITLCINKLMINNKT